MKLPFLAKVAAFFILFSARMAYADWTWENDLAVAKLTPKGYEASFIFHNTGKTNITVTDVAFDCPCTVSHFKSTTAKPGETGMLTIVVESEKEGLGDDLDAIVSGSSSTKSHELTIRLGTPEQGK